MEGRVISYDIKTGETTESFATIPDPTIEEIAARDAKIVADKIDTLWKAAHNYEGDRISGSAIGLLALGISQNKPKAIAVKNWINSIWTLYYTRKALITSASTVDTDFSSCGPIPHTVPELMAELGV